MPLTKAQLRRLQQTEAAHGNRVEAARRMLNLSQLAMQEQAGIRQTYISAVERGNYRTVTVDSARRFAEFFGCTIEDLFPSEQEAAVAR